MRAFHYRIRLFLVLIAVIIITGLYLVAERRLTVDPNIIASLPQGDPVLADARDILRDRTIKERIAVDISQSGEDPGSLVVAAEWVELRLRQSGLFKDVGLGQTAQVFPELIAHVTNNLPILFGAQEPLNRYSPFLSLTVYAESSQRLAKPSADWTPSARPTSLPAIR